MQKEMLAASMLEAITSAREVNGVFSDYGHVNKEILESALATTSSPPPTAPLAVKETVLPCKKKPADTTTAVLETEDDEFDFCSDFGADIFPDEEPSPAVETSYAEISHAVLLELKASESVTRDEAETTREKESEIWDEISLEDRSFDESQNIEPPPFGKAAVRESETVDANIANQHATEPLYADTDDADEKVFAPETFGKRSQDDSLNSSPVSASNAAIEILSQAADTEESPLLQSGDLIQTSQHIPSSDLNVQRQNIEPELSERSDCSTGSLRSELKKLTETLRNEFRQSLELMQASQAAANAAQSEVLKTLTEIMFQSAGTRETPVDAIEKAFSGVEERLMSRIEAMAGCAVPAQNATAATPSGPVPAGVGVGSPMKLQNAASSVTRSWEQIKSEIMNKEEMTDSSSASRSQKAMTSLPEVAQLTSDRHFRLPEQDMSLEIPRAIDPEAASDQELRDAFREREAFITTLIARIRRQQESATGQLSADQLQTLAEELPEELAKQVRHTLKQMDDLARMGELELSLERARIARQVNQLAHSRQLLERNARQMGMIVNADGSIVHGPNQAGRGSGSRRWLGKLGFGQ
jgi:hypothetical protein